jgi:hypothetical protein
MSIEGNHKFFVSKEIESYGLKVDIEKNRTDLWVLKNDVKMVSLEIGDNTKKDPLIQSALTIIKNKSHAPYIGYSLSNIENGTRIYDRKIIKTPIELFELQKNRDLSQIIPCYRQPQELADEVKEILSFAEEIDFTILLKDILGDNTIYVTEDNIKKILLEFLNQFPEKYHKNKIDLFWRISSIYENKGFSFEEDTYKNKYKFFNPNMDWTLVSPKLNLGDFHTTNIASNYFCNKTIEILGYEPKTVLSPTAGKGNSLIGFSDKSTKIYGTLLQTDVNFLRINYPDCTVFKWDWINDDITSILNNLPQNIHFQENFPAGQGKSGNKNLMTSCFEKLFDISKIKNITATIFCNPGEIGKITNWNGEILYAARTNGPGWYEGYEKDYIVLIIKCGTNKNKIPFNPVINNLHDLYIENNKIIEKCTLKFELKKPKNPRKNVNSLNPKFLVHFGENNALVIRDMTKKKYDNGAQVLVGEDNFEKIAIRSLIYKYTRLGEASYEINMRSTEKAKKWFSDYIFKKINHDYSYLSDNSINIQNVNWRLLLENEGVFTSNNKIYEDVKSPGFNFK